MNNLVRKISFTSVEYIQLAKDRRQGIMFLVEVTTWQQAGEGAPHGDQQVSHRQVHQVVVGGGSAYT